MALMGWRLLEGAAVSSVQATATVAGVCMAGFVSAAQLWTVNGGRELPALGRG